MLVHNANSKLLRFGVGDSVSSLLKTACKKAQKDNPASCGVSLADTDLYPRLSADAVRQLKPVDMQRELIVHRTIIDTFLATTFPVGKRKKSIMPRRSHFLHSLCSARPTSCFDGYIAKLDHLLASLLPTLQHRRFGALSPTMVEMETKVVECLVLRCPAVNNSKLSTLQATLQNSYDALWAEKNSSWARVIPSHRTITCAELELIIRTHLLRQQMTRYVHLGVFGFGDMDM